MWAPGALHDRLSRGAAIHHHACAEDVHAEGDAGFEFAGKSHRKPRLMKAGIIDSRPTRSVGMIERFHLAPPIGGVSGFGAAVVIAVAFVPKRSGRSWPGRFRVGTRSYLIPMYGTSWYHRKRFLCIR